MSDIDFLKKLQDSIWKQRSPGGYKDEIPEVSEAVLKTVFNIIEENRLGIKIHNACMGFGIGITIYDNPIYLGVGLKPILQITNNHLGKNKRFEDGWAAFHPFVERNQDLLLEPLREKYYYDY